jgi:hypothetical protein
MDSREYKEDIMIVTYSKPPLGVIPQKIWKEHRIQELTRAIYEYASLGNYILIMPWVEELRELLR